MPLTPPSHFPNPLQPLACLRALSVLKKTLHHCPPISALTTPYVWAPPPLTVLMLQQRPQNIPPMLPSALLRPPPTCLMLSATYHLYATVLDPWGTMACFSKK
ncbi:hypothetical protein O181_030830 [Austropuccinia psidii MF-1]|uniref:Uncharacterized protein n=1 Tax=Austropuccinia psidii MF-1 TaxID=1389203 RepID=A0A9Q3CWV6_9BASI|nr:hypothetical protein [Austropuccinia psidii MF-1]